MTFEEFAAARLPAVLKLAGVLTGDRGLAEDVVQEVLIRASARWQTIALLDRPEAYVNKMIVNEYLSWRRRSWRLVLSGAGTDLHARPTPDPATGYAERDAMVGELAKLPSRQRTVLVLRYYEGLSDAEIAKVLGCRPGTVRGYACRALAALRVELSAPAPAPVPLVPAGARGAR
jgi:RNA polymerase sigma-70 factor (sigma-E family)